MLETNKIYLEDCLEGMKKIDNQSIDAIICDLPYGTTACSWDSVIPFNLLWKQYKRIIKPNGAIVLFGAEPFSSLLRMSNLKWYKYDWYWQKNTCTGFTFAKTQPLRCTETVSVFADGRANYYPQGVVKLKEPIKSVRKENRETIVRSGSLAGEYLSEYANYPKHILRFDKEASKYTFHPTQKPVELLEYLVRTYSRKGELVLDNCMGSGTTAIACLNTDRQFIGFETNEEFYKQALKRIETNATQLSLFDD